MSKPSLTLRKKHRDVFVGLIQTVEKLQKKCIIKFSEADMRIICNQEEGGVHVWSYVVTPSLTFFSMNDEPQKDPR